MKKPILTLPCKYTITDFTKQAHGYHCQNCDKELHDFRNASNSEINSKIKNSERSVCGIFNQSQVAAKTSMLNLPLWNSRVSLSLLGILGFLGPIVSSCSTEEKPIQEKKQQAFNVLKFPMRLRGSVCDHVTRKIIPNAEIKIIQNGKIIRVEKTDENGFFDFFLLKSELSNETFDLVFKSTDFVADTLEKFSFEEAKTKQIQLSLQASVIEKTDIVTMTVGDVVCEPLQGIVAPEPVLSGVPMEVAEPEMPIEIGKVEVSEPVKEVAPPTTENTDKHKRRRKKN